MNNEMEIFNKAKSMLLDIAEDAARHGKLQTWKNWIVLRAVLYIRNLETDPVSRAFIHLAAIIEHSESPEQFATDVLLKSGYTEAALNRAKAEAEFLLNSRN